MKFEFKAFTQEGKPKEGIISAKDKDEALKILQEQGFLVTYLAEKKIGLFQFLQRISRKDVYIFTRQLSYLIKAKTPLDESVKSLSETTQNFAFKDILIEIYNDLVSGLSFSHALSRYPNIFDSYYIGMVKVGESVGALEETLYYLANHLENQIKFKNKIIQALIYPAFVVIMFIAVMIILFYFVIPQITKLFVDNNIPIPTVTRIFQSISNVLTKSGLIILVIAGFLVYYLYEYFKTREGRLVYFQLISGIPIIGPLIKNTYSAQFLESLYYLSKGGVPILEALMIIRDSIDHPLYESALDSIIEDVKRGRSLSESLSDFPNLFSTIIIEGMKTSEKTGQLTEVTLTLLNFYNEMIETQFANLGEALQPILILVLGAGLGFLEASLLIPLLTLTKYVQSF